MNNMASLTLSFLVVFWILRERHAQMQHRNHRLRRLPPTAARQHAPHYPCLRCTWSLHAPPSQRMLRTCPLHAAAAPRSPACSCLLRLWPLHVAAATRPPSSQCLLRPHGLRMLQPHRVHRILKCLLGPWPVHAATARATRPRTLHALHVANASVWPLQTISRWRSQ